MPPLIQAAVDDFDIFLHLLMESRRMSPYPLQSHICESFYMSDEPRKMLMAFRGEGKTEKNTGYGLWRLYQDPDTTVMVISAREQRAIDIVAAMRNFINSTPFLSHLKPKRENDDLAGRKRFTVGCRSFANIQPSVVAYGMDSQITGNHVDHIISDDIEIPQNSRTQEAREKILRVVQEFERIKNPGGTITMIGTPQTTDSVYFKLSKKYWTMRVPVEFPDPTIEDECKFVPNWLFEEMDRLNAKPGDSVMPEKFGRMELLESRAEDGASEYSLQMLLDPGSADEFRYPLKLRDFIVWHVDTAMAPRRLLHGKTKPAREIPSVGMGTDMFYWPIHVDEDFQPYERSVMYVDPAGMGADEVGFYVGKTLNGQIFIPTGGGLKGGYDDPTMQRLIFTAVEQDVKEIYVETNWGGSKTDSMYVEKLRGMLLKMGLHISVEGVYNTGQKEIRIIETLEPAMNSHRIVIDEKIARDQELMTQLTRLQRERGCLKHDDRVEALAGVVSVLREHLILDPEKLLEEQEERERMELLNEFRMEIGRPTNIPQTMLRSRGSRMRSRRRGR